MAKYGNEFYGLTTYGTGSYVDFDASPFTAKPNGYGEIRVEWNNPTGDWSSLRLVRNTFGFPVTPDDGDILLEISSASNDRFYLDSGAIPNNTGLIEGQIYYYSVFVKSSSAWLKAGETLGISVKKYGTPELMYEYLPTVLKISSMNAYLTSEQENNDLKNFLSVFGFEYDLFKTSIENIKNRYDVLKLDGRLIPVLLNEFGMRYEKELGLQQARTMLRNAVKIYSERGSLSGIKTFVSAFTGYNCDLKPVTNLMLSLDDSSFRETIGFWANKSNATLTRATATTETPAVSPYEEPSSPSNFPNSSLGFLKVTAVGNGDVEIMCGNTNIRTRAIPVEPGNQYTLSLFSRAKTSAKTVVTDIFWYTADGVFLGTAGEHPYTNTTSAWTRSVGATGVPPSEARFAVPYVRINSATAGDVVYFDAVQFEQSGEATPFVDARRIDVVLRANRINQVLNPSFETDVSNWQASNGVLQQDPSSSGLGDFSAKLTISSSALASVETIGTVSAVSKDQHAVSGYVNGPAGVEARLAIDWIDQIDSLISTSYSTYTELSGSWVRLTLETLSPETAIKARIRFEFNNGSSGDAVYLDNILFEKASYVSPYFDGSFGYAQETDVVWENNTNNTSRGHYYKNREVVTKRLIAVLGDYIPSGTAWAVFIAQPD